MFETKNDFIYARLRMNMVRQPVRQTWLQFNRLEPIQRLVTGMRHLRYEERLQRLGLYSLQRRRPPVDLITAFKIFTDFLDIDPNLFFLPLARRGLKRDPYMVL